MSIKAGDLVVVTRPQPCCGDDEGVGSIYRVQKVETIRSVFCGKCKRKIADNMPIAFEYRNAGSLVSIGYSVPRLTRIDPLPEEETQDNHERLTA